MSKILKLIEVLILIKLVDIIVEHNTVMFATVPNSRINSWESWFIFNLQKINIQA